MPSLFRFRISKSTLTEVKTLQLNTLSLPFSLAELSDMEYRPVVVRGHFIHEKEIYMGPRSYMHNGDTSTKSSLMSENSDHIGYLVITPFKLADREWVIECLNSIPN